MTVRFNTTLRNLLADALAGVFDVLEIRSGSQPADANTAASGTLLATITLPGTAFSAASGGSAAKTGTWSTTGAAAGTAGWFRMRNTGDTQRADGSVGATGSGADLELSSTTIAVGGAVVVTGGSIVQPAS